MSSSAPSASILHSALRTRDSDGSPAKIPGGSGCCLAARRRADDSGRPGGGQRRRPSGNWAPGLIPSTTGWRWTASRSRAKRKLYVALNKPPGLVCSRSDEFERPTIYGLLPKEWGHLHSVGRLDYNSEGLIFLTNDGEFSLRLTHPRYGVRKKYVATVEGRVAEEMLGRFTRGLCVSGGEVEGGKGAAGFGQPGAERGGIGIGPGQVPRSAAAVRVATGRW